MRTLRVFLLLLASAIAASAATETAAHVENPVKEADLALVKLTPQAEQRLGVATARVEKRRVPQARLLAAEVVLPLATETAPIAPVLTASPDEMRRVAELQEDADGAVRQATTTLAAAETALARAEQMHAQRAGGERAVDDARAVRDLAQGALKTAREKRGFLGAPVEEAARSPRRWVRVSVPSSELSRLDTVGPAEVSRLGGKDVPLVARPVAAPPSANALAGTVDLFYEPEPPSGNMEPLRVGERVAARIPAQGSDEERLVVPWVAVVYDFHGGAWVYEQLAPQTYTRHRVSVARVQGKDAVLAAGPPPGTKVVTDGVAEIFGTEFGVGK